MHHIIIIERLNSENSELGRFGTSADNWPKCVMPQVCQQLYGIRNDLVLAENLSARTYPYIKSKTTIADLEHTESLIGNRIAEAIQYRS